MLCVNHLRYDLSDERPLLAALRAGAWVLLDELNLAPQAVLEGLNALLDHRREVFVPELNQARTHFSPSPPRGARAAGD